jgi:hypothetical protein
VHKVIAIVVAGHLISTSIYQGSRHGKAAQGKGKMERGVSGGTFSIQRRWNSFRQILEKADRVI